MVDQAARLRQLVDKSEYEVQPAAPASQLSLSAMGPRVIAITSGKGGVGKTNIAVNLAIALGQAGQRVLVIDADLGMANVDVVLGSMSKKHLLNLLERDTELKDVMMHGPYGVTYISGGSGIEKAADFTYEERQRLMQKLTACGQMADIILIDTGAGLGKNVMDFILAADEVLLVTTPEPTALTDAYAVLKAYSMYAAHKNIKLLVNRVYDEAESREVVIKLQHTSKRFLNMDIDCLGYVFEDSAVMKAVRQQQPFLAAQPHSVASRCIQGLVNSILYGSKMTVKRGWKGFLRQIFNFAH
ncbi:putative flagellar biosynthesis protein FlhG [Selenomonas ruminantium subsp. lactilytica TAM6421]|uniref:Putative flagellar biosynthesis protein FlhG n=1 Tax=Selenomonas ruminantium subsp. lactilytica (strain NBRC 103574 / TAM6421) TaxID=927704 RepID=I0GND0_SELRL|nr:MinD/ParA family protein [Selenomonas ruminantium]BAL82267.1 putative flagellar biosynthesis protein FlhG [Selenomonas ruminantium subsp. lactilytica TAM6421]